VRLRLFCFPFAGGGASAFQAWRPRLPADIELCALQPPGREGRLAEPAFQSLSAMLDALEPVLVPLMDRPYVFLGYSMGARVALELARRLRMRGLPLPRGMILAALEAPRVRTLAPIHSLPEAELLQALRRYEGTPTEVLENRELMQLLLPLIRADFAISETPAFDAPPLPCSFAVWGGAEDTHVSPSDLELWREETTGGVHVRLFPGGHFFLRTAREQVLQALREQLDSWARPGDE
jgi:medium-chain acyl-[acyl-carrier-protein] hydrolase